MEYFLFFLSDELLQEQRADMDQFTSSISESQVDVRVSSEESEEIPLDGKPFRPFQVKTFPALPESEGKWNWKWGSLALQNICVFS